MARCCGLFYAVYRERICLYVSGFWATPASLRSLRNCVSDGIGGSLEKKGGATVINLHLGDWLDAATSIKDSQYDLALLDPQYGIKQDGRGAHTRGGNVKQKNGSVKYVPPRPYTAENWDEEPPDDNYFEQVFRVSRHQIIWGGNYFKQLGPVHKTPRRPHLQQWLDEHPTNWIVWDKMNGETDFNDFELAWTSLSVPTLVFRFMWNGMLQGSSITNGHIPHGNKKLNQKRIHPTEKPRLLYKWTLNTYAEPDWSILDTGFGSGSIADACYDLGFGLDAWERIPLYYQEAAERHAKFVERRVQQKRQMNLFS